MINPCWEEIIQAFGVNEAPVIVKEGPEYQEYKCGYRKSQCGKKQISEGCDEFDVFPSNDSFQHIIQAGDPKENGLQEQIKERQVLGSCTVMEFL